MKVGKLPFSKLSFEGSSLILPRELSEPVFPYGIHTCTGTSREKLECEILQQIVLTFFSPILRWVEGSWVLWKLFENPFCFVCHHPTISILVQRIVTKCSHVFLLMLIWLKQAYICEMAVCVCVYLDWSHRIEVSGWLRDAKWPIFPGPATFIRMSHEILLYYLTSFTDYILRHI